MKGPRHRLAKALGARSEPLLSALRYVAFHPRDLRLILRTLRIRSVERPTVIEVAPSRIRFSVLGKYLPRWGVVFFSDADVKRRVPHDAEHVVGVSTVEDLFVEGRSPEATAEYELMSSMVRAGRSPHRGYAARQGEVDRYFEDLRGTYLSIRERGYLSQRELGGADRDEVNVYVARDGELLSGPGGKHRSHLAKVMDIPKIQVHVRAVHFLWLRPWLLDHGADVEVAFRKSLEALEFAEGAAP